MVFASSAICLITIWFGFEIVSFFAPSSWDCLLILAGGIPVGIALVSWIFFGLRFVLSLNFLIGIHVCMLLLTFSFFLHIVVNKRRFFFRPITIEFFIIFTLLMVLFWFQTDKAFLREGYISAGTVFSDLPFHLGVITSFAYGKNSINGQMKTPFFGTETLRYPIIPDFYSSLLIFYGNASLRVSLTVPTILLLFSFLICLYSYCQSFSKQRFVGELSLLIYLFTAGVGWKWYFRKECRENGNANLAHCFCQDRYTFWIHPLIHYLFPQRSGLFSMPIVLLISLLFHQFIERDFVLKHRHDYKLPIFAGFLMGLLPMISAHSFLAAGEFAIGICILSFPWRHFTLWFSRIKYWAVYAIVALAEAIPQVFYLTRRKMKGFMSIKPNWIESNGNHLLAFFQLWWESLGSFYVIALFFCWFLLSKRQTFYLSAAYFVFVISTFVLYQPGAMDNNKVFFAGWYPTASAAVSQWIVLLWTQVKYSSKLFSLGKSRRATLSDDFDRKNLNDKKKNKYFKKIVRYCICIVCVSIFFGSCVAVSRFLRYDAALFNQMEIQMGIYVMNYTKRDSLIFGSPWHSNPLMCIGGRSIWIGYLGWVWTHGFNHNQRMQESDVLAHQKQNDRDAFLHYGMRYTLSKTDDETRNFEFPDPELYSQWTLLFELGNNRLFRIVKI